MKLRIVLSLFDDVGTLRQALENVGITYERYYASEIDRTAVKLTREKFPDIIHLGDVRNWRSWDLDWSHVDLIGSGSPCQDLSIAGKKAGRFSTWKRVDVACN